MKTKKMQSIIISSLFVAGLAGCSSSQPYNSDNDSPWKAKHDAELESASSEEFVELTLDESVEVNSMDEVIVADEMMLESDMVEAEMIDQPEMESISDFDPEPVPVEEMSAFERLEMESVAVEAEPEVMEIEAVDASVEVSTDSADIMSGSSNGYAVQVYAGRLLENVTRYQSSHNLDNMQIVKTDRDGEIIHVLVSIHDDYESAVQASIDLEESTGSTPWVRSVAGLRNMSVE